MDWPNMVRGAYRSRTLWVSVLMAVVGVIETQTQSIAQFIPRHAYAYVMIVCAVVMGVLRVLTIESLTEKGGGQGKYPDARSCLKCAGQDGGPTDAGNTDAH